MQHIDIDSQATMQNQKTNDEQSLASLGQSYRFKPTDEELVSFLARKLAGHSVPSHLIPQLDIYKFSPQQLKARYKGNGDDSMFFFSPRNRKSLSATRPDRRVGDIGYWKASRTIRLKRKNCVVGSKMILNFHVGTPKKSTNTHWIMEEFILKEKSVMTHQNPATSSANSLDKKQFDDFCLYKIHYHKTKADKQECHDTQEMEIPNQVSQNRALEPKAQQNQPYWIMPIGTFNPAISTSAHYLGSCEPISPFPNNGNCLAAAMLPEASMGESTFSMPSMPLDTFAPATVTSAHSSYYSSNSEPITPIFNNVGHSAAPLLEPSMEDSATMLSASTASTPAIHSESQQNQPSMMMPVDTFNPATSTSAHYLGSCEPITPFPNNGNYLSAAMLPEASMGESIFSMPSMPLDTFAPATVTSTETSAHSSYYSNNSEPITPIFNNVGHSAAPLLEPSMEDSATMLSVSTASTPAIQSLSQQNQPSMMMPVDKFNPATSTQFLGNCELITDFLDNGNCTAAALLQAPSLGDCMFSTASMPLNTFIPAAAISTATPTHPSYYSSNGEAMEDFAALLSVSTAPTPAHSTPAVPSMPFNGNDFMPPQWPTVDESTTEDFGAFNLWNSPVNVGSTTEDFDGFKLWNWNF